MLWGPWILSSPLRALCVCPLTIPYTHWSPPAPTRVLPSQSEMHLCRDGGDKWREIPTRKVFVLQPLSDMLSEFLQEGTDMLGPSTIQDQWAFMCYWSGYILSLLCWINLSREAEWSNSCWHSLTGSLQNESSVVATHQNLVGWESDGYTLSQIESSIPRYWAQCFCSKSDFTTLMTIPSSWQNW